jgi:DNA-binding CsgD family transcriptional regulator
VVTSRLPHLSPDAARFVEVAAVFGRAFSVDDAADVFAEPAAQLASGLQEAVDTRVLIRDGDQLSFRDGLVRDGVYDRIARGERVVLHGRIARLFVERGDTAGAAAHLAQAARRGDGHALAGLDRAARELLISSPDSAADLAVRALSLTAPNDDARHPRTLAAVHALIGVGRMHEAMKLAQTATAEDGTPRRFAAPLRLSLAQLAVMGSRADDAVADADAVLAMTGLDAELYASAEQTRLLALTVDGDFAPAREPAEAILAGGVGAGGDASVAAALTALGSISWTEGRAADAIGLFRAAAQRAEAEPLELHQLRPRQSLAVVLAATGAFNEAEVLLLEDRDRVSASGDWAGAIAAATWLSRLHIAAGRLAEAISEGETAVALSQEMQSTLFVPLARATLAAAALLRGDLGRATAELERSRSANTAATPFESDLCDWIEARIIASRGDSAQAVQLMSNVYAEPSSHKRLFLEEAGAAAWLVRAALAAGDRPRAERVAAAAELLASDNESMDSVVATAAQARGLLGGDPALIDAAAGLHRQPWARASAREDCAVLLADRDRPAARVQLERSVELFEQMHADHDAERVTVRLRGLEGRRGADRESDVDAWDTLSESERRVARLVAEGLTNRQVAERMFLSRHTVDFHLRQVFRKLGINSRVELVSLAVERGDT